jgi:succinylglutamate desuccinylase
MSDSPAALPQQCRRSALAEADFSAVAQRFTAAGFGRRAGGRHHHDQGGWSRVHAARPAVLISVGVHGDETGPIEVVAYLLDALSHQPSALAVDLMLCVGSIDAIRAGKRFIDADLNRMFREQRGTLEGTAEAARADVMIAATTASSRMQARCAGTSTCTRRSVRRCIQPSPSCRS